jgi:hypothetical protein
LIHIVLVIFQLVDSVFNARFVDPKMVSLESVENSSKDAQCAENGDSVVPMDESRGPETAEAESANAGEENVDVVEKKDAGEEVAVGGEEQLDNVPVEEEEPKKPPSYVRGVTLEMLLRDGYVKPGNGVLTFELDVSLPP